MTAQMAKAQDAGLISVFQASPLAVHPSMPTVTNVATVVAIAPSNGITQFKAITVI